MPTPLLITLLIAVIATQPACGQDASPGSEIRSEQTQEKVEPALRQLMIEFEGVTQSIPAGQLQTPYAQELLMAIGTKFAAYNAAATTPSPVALTQELLITTLLEDHASVDAQVTRFLDAFPDRIDIALRWTNYTANRNPGNLVAVFAALQVRYPDHPQLTLERGRRLRWDARFEEAVTTLELLDEEHLSQISAAVAYSDALYATGRFHDAVAAMEAVSEGELDMADKGMSSRYLRVLPARRKIIASWTEEVERRAIDAARDDLPRVLLETSRGPIVIELYEDDAPNTVANFITLVEDGFYDSTAFHRVVRTFMTQGGDPFTKPGGTGQVGNGHPGWGIADEATPESHRKHFAGAVAMAKHRAPDSGASQFYITHQPTPHLDGRQTVFGRVVSGLEHAQLMQVRDRITSATVIRKRDHEYVVTKIAAYELPNAPSGNLPGWDQNGSPAKPTPSSTAPLPAPPSSPPATPQPQRPSPSTP